MHTITVASQSRRPIRRCVRHTETLADGKETFITKSFTKNDGTEYEPIIDPVTGEFSCTCPDHVFRHRACKHVRRALANLVRSKGVVFGSELRSLAPREEHAPVLQATRTEADAYYRALSDEELEAMAPPVKRGFA